MRVLKLAFITGIVIQAVLCVMAWLYYKERLVLPDDANYLFELLSNDGGFAVFHNRFIALPTQILPWVAIRGGASLALVAKLYSLNLELFYAACFLICGLALRNYRLAIGCLLCHLLLTRDTFFWSVSELPLCIALLFPIAALLETAAGRTTARNLIIAACMITIAFGHSLALFAVAFMLAFLWLQQPEARRRIMLAGGFYGVALLVKMIFFRDPYDRGALGGLRNFTRLFPDYFSTASFGGFLQRCLGDFMWLPLLFLLLLVWFLARRQWLTAATVCIACLGYLMLVTVCFPQPDPTRFYPENLVQPLAFFLAFPVSAILLRSDRRHVMLVLVGLILINCVIRISIIQQRYASRLDWQRELIRRHRDQKVILPESGFAPEQYLLSWSSPYELWLLSSLETGSAASIVITKDPQESMNRIGTERKAFLPAFGIYYYDKLPQRYFPFRDTSLGYRIAAPGR